MSIEKSYFSESQKSLSQQLLVVVSVFRFHFLSTLPYLDCYSIIMRSAAKSLVTFKAAFETCIFFSVFLPFER